MGRGAGQCGSAVKGKGSLLKVEEDRAEGRIPKMTGSGRNKIKIFNTAYTLFNVLVCSIAIYFHEL